MGKLLGIGWLVFSSADVLQALAQGNAVWAAAVLGHHVRREKDSQETPLGFKG